MKIENSTIETSIDYRNDTEDDNGYRNPNKPYNVLKISFPVPLGNVEYKIEISRELAESIELASKLNTKK